MKKASILVILALSFMGSLSAQIKVGAAGSNPNASAILELEGLAGLILGLPRAFASRLACFGIFQATD